MPKIMRAVAYPRYSSDNQTVESISAQMRAIENYCIQKGYVLIDSYPDEAKTATSDNRPNFQRMILDSAKKLFDVIVVHKLDRFARDRHDSAIYKRILKKNGVKVDSVLENLDGSPESVILESVLEGMAEYFSLNLAREVRKGMEENAENAKHAGGTAPYGLKVNKETLLYEIDPKTNRAVQIYFESVAKMIPLEDIADNLNSLGYRTATGNPFKNTSFSNWAKNRKYKGDYTWDVSLGRSEEKRSMKERDLEKQKIKLGAIPRTVSDELWECVNAMKEPRKHRGAEMKAIVPYLLSGKVVCGNPECKAIYAGTSYLQKTKRYNYYRCNNKCGNTGVNKEELEALVINMILDQCFIEEAMSEIVERIKAMYREKRQTSKIDMDPIIKELSELKKKMDTWLDLVGEGILDKSLFVERMSSASQRKDALTLELNKIKAMQKVEELDGAEITKALQIEKDLLLSGSDEEKKQVLQKTVESVTVLHTKESLNVDLVVRYFSNAGEAALLIYLNYTSRKT